MLRVSASQETNMGRGKGGDDKGDTSPLHEASSLAISSWLEAWMPVGSPCSSETSSMAIGSVGSLCSNETSSSFVNSSLPDDQLLISRGSSPIPVHVVIVMDALKGFSWGPLLWALDHFQETGCTITLLGVMPWIPLALSCKSWQDVWGIREPHFGALSTPEGPIEWKNDQKSQKMKGIVQLCHQKGVIPCMRVAMGHPMRLLVLEQTTSLNATFVVLDRHLRKNKRFFAERLPSDVVMMNRDGRRVDMLKIRSMMDNQEYSTTPADHHYSSPATIPPSPQIILSHELTQLLRRMQNPWKKNEKIIIKKLQKSASL